MFITPSTKLLTQTELEQLSDFLCSSDRAVNTMGLTELHGFFCALMSAPDLVMPSKWQPIVFAGSPEFESLSEAQKIIGIMMQLNNQVSQQLRGEKQFEFLMWENNTKIPYEECSFDLLSKWCRGYLRGANMDVRWLSEEHRSKTLFPFTVLSRMPDYDQNKGDDHDKKKLKDNLLKHVKDNYKYWAKARLDYVAMYGQPNQSKTNKTGRNEACFCGSGKKHKHCCGTPVRVN